ncbi:hypothetical protein GJ496_005142 [Pomphorhynchus laevis]|nr:hypothetical protein GJ496_005142 [Pomphorhynchus laevis]
MNKRQKRRLKRKHEIEKASKEMTAERKLSKLSDSSKPTKDIAQPMMIPRKSRRNKYILLAHPELRQAVQLVKHEKLEARINSKESDQQKTCHPSTLIHNNSDTNPAKRKPASIRKRCTITDKSSIKSGESDAIINSDHKSTGKLMDKLKSKLLGGQFRYLSEQFYKRTGETAMEYFNAENCNEFIMYHKAYSEQLKRWPKDPLDWVCQWINRHCSPLSIVVDLGCGAKARLATKIKHKTRSFDLASLCPEVEKCNFADVIPMEDNSADVCVFCLSLMTIDSGRSLRQANRILKVGGTLLIVELSSRLNNNSRRPESRFINALENFGFTCEHALVEQFFCYFALNKTGKPLRRTKKIPLELCVYKKR